MNIISRIFRVLIIGVVIGAFASLCTIAFIHAIVWLNELLFVTAGSRSNLPQGVGWSVIIITIPALGGLVAGGLLLWLPERRAHSPAEVIEAAQSGGGVSLRGGLVTIGAVLAGLGGGASVGVYGPLVHLGATIGSAVSRVARVEPTLALGCGVAAAISTAFNAPIAGIIFAHEVVLRHYSLRAFAPITIASSTGLIIGARVLNRPPLLETSVSHTILAPEFFAFCIIGVGGALVAVIFMRGIHFMRALGERTALPIWLRPVAAGLCIGVAATWLPEILGDGVATLRAVLIQETFSAAELSVLLIAKIIATALCLGFGFAGGVVSPALLIGVLFGALCGLGAEFLHGEPHTGLAFYAICGMAAVVSPVIGAPLATILIIFELTHNYELTTAAMLSVAFANVVAYRLFGRSLYDRELSLRGVDLSSGRDKIVLYRATIDDYITQDFIRARTQDSLPEIRRALLAAACNEAFVVDDNDAYLGVITLQQIVTDDDHSAQGYAQKDALCFTAGMSVWDAMQAMENFAGESIAVIDNAGCMLGVVRQSVLLKAYLQTVRRLRAEENADQ